MNEASPDEWDRHWAEYDRSAQLNPAQAYRRRLLLGVLARWASSSTRLLDVGSGQGDLAADLHRAMPDVAIVGLELSSSGCAIAQRKVPEARFVEKDLLVAEDPPPELAAWATVAVCSEVLEHVDDPVLLLRHAAAFMSPGCPLVVTVPGGPMSAFDKTIGHRGHFTRERLRSVLEGAGFSVDQVMSAGFPFHNLYRLAVIAMGDRLAEDARFEEGTQPPLAARLAATAFGLAFRANLASSPWGWQQMAIARAPSPG